MKRSWIKLYLEILDDPKMGRIPDWLWRRAIELFLLAGENGDDGLLQPVPDMAWRLRTSCEKLTESLQALSEVGVVHETQPGQWVVTNFKRRQYSESWERTKRWRERHGDAASDAPVTKSESSSPSSSVLEEGVQGEEQTEDLAPVIASANKTVDYMLETARHKSYANRDKIPEPYLAFCDLYNQLTGQEPTKRVINEWLMGFEEWKQEGLQPEHIRKAFEVAMNPERGFSVARPAALTKTAVAVKTRMGYAAQKQGPQSELDKARKLIGGMHNA